MKQAAPVSVRITIYIYVCVDGVVREVNTRLLVKEIVLLPINGGKFEINPLLFADDTTPATDSEDNLCKLVSDFGRVCQQKKLSVNVG